MGRGNLTCLDSVLSASMYGFGRVGFTHATGISHYIQSCAMCEKLGSPSAPLLRCSGCGLVRYCSKACQAKHWKQHNHKQVGDEHDRPRPEPN
jgi:hypothetical protein